MKKYTINLTEHATEDGFVPSFDAYILDKTDDGPRPVVVICPGGAYYGVCANWEGERIAMSYISAGFHALVLNYTTESHGRFPRQIKELASTISYCRNMANDWQISSDKIAVCGFSAGGHLAASISTLWNCDEIFTKEEIETENHKPNASILCYPVISSGDFGHKDSFINLLGSSDESSDTWKLVSLENQVTASTPPAFLWHTFADSAVPVENSMLYASALRKKGIPFELHIYPKGEHGLSLASHGIARSKSIFMRDYDWHKLSVDWLYEVFGII